MIVHALIEVDLTRAADADPDSDLSDIITDALTEALGTPHVRVLDVAEQGEPAFERTKRL